MRVGVRVCASFMVQKNSTPLHWACRQEDNEAVVGLLLGRGADPNVKGRVRMNTHPAHAPRTCAHHTCPWSASLMLMRGAEVHGALLLLY